MVSLGKEIKKARIDKGLNQKDVKGADRASARSISAPLNVIVSIPAGA